MNFISVSFIHTHTHTHIDSINFILSTLFLIFYLNELFMVEAPLLYMSISNKIHTHWSIWLWLDIRAFKVIRI